eukprot:237036_1
MTEELPKTDLECTTVTTSRESLEKPRTFPPIMTEDLPTTDLAFGTLTTSQESIDGAPQPTAIARMFTQANYTKTHTQHHSAGPSQVSQPRDLADPVSPQELDILNDEKPTTPYATANTHGVKAAIIS